MTQEFFQKFNELANYNLNVRGNISKPIVAYMNLAKIMDKEEIAKEMINSLPEASALNNPDYRLDEIKKMYEQPVMEQQRTR